MFILTIFFKIKEARLSFSQGIVTVLSIMENCQDVRVKLTNTKLNKLKFASKNKTGTILRINKKIFQGELTHELFLTTRQTNQTRNPFANDMPTDIKLSKVQIFKIIQSTNQITNYFNCKPRFNDIFSRNNLPRIKNGVYVINLDDKKSKGTYWVSLFIDGNRAAYFDSFGIEYIPQDVLSKTKDKSITHNIFTIQDN